MGVLRDFFEAGSGGSDCLGFLGWKASGSEFVVSLLEGSSTWAHGGVASDMVVSSGVS